jgi:hypothetical protein
MRYQGGIYDQQDATNSQYFIVIISLQFRAPDDGQ